MPAFTLKFGSLDLSPYLRVGNDEGFDPYDGGGFEEPAFIDNPFGEGQGLSNVDSRNREMSWPLYLNASTKDGLHTLVRQINQEIRYATRPLRVEWKDQDATSSTFYDVEFARFDPVFKMRPSAQKWLAGVLRVWTKPYGHTATERIVGTAFATHGLATIPLASMAGDVGALVNIGVSASAYRGAPAGGFYYSGNTILAAITPPGHVGFFSASVIAEGNTTTASLVAASGAIGTSAMVMAFLSGGVVAKGAMGFALSPSVYAGNNRVLMLARHSSATRAAFVYGGRCEVTAASVAGFDIPDATQAILAASGIAFGASGVWGLVDLGVLSVDPALSTATAHYILRIGAGSFAATTLIDVNGVFVLPEESGFAVADIYNQQFSGTQVAASYMLSGVDGRTTRLSGSYVNGQSPWNVRDEDITYAMRGTVPQAVPGASNALFIAQVPLTVGSLGYTTTSPNQPLNVEVRVRERFTFAR